MRLPEKSFGFQAAFTPESRRSHFRHPPCRRLRYNSHPATTRRPPAMQPFPPIIRPLKFYAVVPDTDWVARMADAGADTVQLRSKTLTGEALRREIRRAIAATRGSHSQLFINDHWQLALEEGAYGVHLGQEDMDRADFAALARAGIRLGLSTHDEAEMARALAVQRRICHPHQSHAHRTAGTGQTAPLRAAGRQYPHCGHRRHHAGKCARRTRHRRVLAGRGQRRHPRPRPRRRRARLPKIVAGIRLRTMQPSASASCRVN